MQNFLTLAESLNQQLEVFGYVRDNKHVIPNAIYISFVKNSKIFIVRNACAVLDIPDNLDRIDPLKRYFNFIRSNLLSEYGDAILWKELEFCLVGICSPQAFKVIKDHEAKMVEAVSFSLQSMLGCCFIDRESLDYYAYSTWGLFFAGAHFKAVQRVVENWCQNHKSGPAGLIGQQAPA